MGTGLIEFGPSQAPVGHSGYYCAFLCALQYEYQYVHTNPGMPRLQAGVHVDHRGCLPCKLWALGLGVSE